MAPTTTTRADSWVRHTAVSIVLAVAAAGAGIIALDASTASGAVAQRCDGASATIIGTPRANRLVGRSGRDVIAALGGDDRLSGAGGDDFLCGGRGADTLLGGRGDDRLMGGGGNDVLDGGLGNDLLNGGAGANTYRGGAGNDIIQAVNGTVDKVVCGSGNDYAVVDLRDLVSQTCEKLTRRSGNRPPSSLSLSRSTIATGSPAGATVGNLSASDPDAGDTRTYRLVGGPGSADNASFRTAGATLRSATKISRRAGSTYSIRARVSDSAGASYERSFRITVTPRNQAPTGIGLSATSLDENQPIGTTVGTLSATDPDPGDTRTFSLAAGAGGSSNSSFKIVGASLQTAAEVDFESKSIYAIRIRVTDRAGMSYDRLFSITVSDLPEAPTALTLSASQVAENEPAGTGVATLSASDPEGGELSYSLASGAGGTSNAQFEVVGSSLRTAVTFDYETKSVYSIRLRVTDTSGLSLDKVASITVANRNDAPADLALSGTSVVEHQPPGTEVGTLSATDQDSGDTASFSLVTGEGDNDNAAFAIDGTSLRTATSLDFADKSTLAVRVRVTDASGSVFEKPVLINVTNVNEAPVEITLTNSSVAEDASPGFQVGTLGSVDPDPGDAASYTLVPGEGGDDNADVVLDGTALKTAHALDFETKPSLGIRVRVTDGDGLTYEKAFVVTVTDVNEAPLDVTLLGGSVAEDATPGTEVGTLAAVDPDAADAATFSLVAGSGDDDNAAFAIDGDSLQTTGDLDFETKSSYSVRVRVTDGGGLTYEKVLVITVTDVLE